jgi:hypothetical protein
MRMIGLLRVAVLAMTVSLSANAALAADDDDDTCDTVMKELNTLGENFMKANDPKGVGPLCAGVGQLIGMMKASRTVAAACYEEGSKRTGLMKNFDEGIKTMEEQLGSTCK